LEHYNGRRSTRRYRTPSSINDWHNRNIISLLESRLLEILAERHNEWIKMAMSFGCDKDQADELVQEMYIRLHRYVENPKKITYKNNQINTFYIYVTLRNLYLSKKHVYTLDNHVELSSKMADTVDPHFDPIDHEIAFKRLIDRIASIVEDWYWYDKKIWDIHFKKQMSMRSISKHTTISLSSIFNTLKNGKTKVKQKAKKSYKDYLDSKETS